MAISAKDPQLEDFYSEIMDDVGVTAGAMGTVVIRAFTQRMCDFLIEQEGQVEDLTVAHFSGIWGNAGLQLDAWHYEETSGDLTLVVTDFGSADVVETIGLTEVKDKFDKVLRFFRCAGADSFMGKLEETEEAYDAAVFIHDCDKQIARVRFILITNKVLGQRVSDEKLKELASRSSRPCEYTVWDLSRYYEATRTLRKQEDIEIDCCNVEKDGLPFLKAPDATSDEYSAYLLMVPGECLFDWYRRYTDRLLEQNVRTFLQSKGKVNQGIRKTIIGAPSRFFAYNNGIAATAEAVELNESGTRIVRIKNLQIVNGGQTTASIYSAANKFDVRLGAIAVQMKLIVVKSTHVEEMVHKISRFANSQNAIKATDLASNDRFQLLMQKFSRTITANPKSAATHGYRWFYERMKGQYANLIATQSSPAAMRRIQEMYPKQFVFNKSDMAKYFLTWDMQPWHVAKGGEKCFQAFKAQRFGSGEEVSGHEYTEKWKSNDAEGNPQFCEYYYKELVAKAIMFRMLDKGMMKQEWCRGYKAQIVTYTLSVFHHLLFRAGLILNLVKIWDRQEVAPAVQTYLFGLAKRVNAEIFNTSNGLDIGEMCKNKELWEHLKKAFGKQEIPDNVRCECADKTVIRTAREISIEKQRKVNGEECLKRVLSTEIRVWNELCFWAEHHREEKCVTASKLEILHSRISHPQLLTKDEGKKLVKFWAELNDAGFPYGPTSDVTEE